MAKSLSSSINLPSIAEMQPGATVRASTWDDLVDAQHYVFGRQGAHILNVVFEPVWESLAYASGGSSYHAQSGATTNPAMLELDQASAVFRFDRHEYNTTNTAQGFRIYMDSYARNLDVRATLTRFNTADGNTGSSTAFTITSSSHSSTDSEWIRTAAEFTPAEASRSGSYSDFDSLAFFAVYVEAKVPASGTGYMHHVALRIAPIHAANNLPRGAIT